jgi:uncharacterized protein YgiM (DUF1202 family)
LKHIKWIFSSILAIVLVFGFYFGTAGAAAHYQIEVNKSTNTLYLYKDGTLEKTYRVATGRTKELTPEGTFTMVVKINKPGWKNIPGGDPKNPLGDKWMGISVNEDNGRTYGIHGTNQPESIGSHASSGCVRMKNEDVNELYNIVPEGTPVWIHSGKSTGKWAGDPSFAVQPTSGELKVTVNLANIRTGPSLGAFVMEQAETGTVLEMTGFVKDWYQIKTPGGKTGFIHSSTVTKNTGSSNQNNFTDATGSIKVTGSVTNIRSNPSLSAPIVQKVNKGTQLVLTGENAEWYRVRLSSGYTAYVHKSVAEKTEAKTPDAQTIKVTVFLANIRNSPSENATIIMRVAQGTELKKIGNNGDWHIIQLKDGRTGFIHHSVAQ